MRLFFRALIALLPFSLPAAAQTNARPTLALVNKSGQAIEELYVSAARSSDWGDDRLGNGTVDRNATFRLRLSDGCLYDIQVVYADKRTEERMRVNLCRTPTQTFTAAEAHAAPAVPTHQFTLENHTVRPISSLSLADTSDTAGAEDWGDNLLSGPLAPGARVPVSFTGDCDMAVRVLFDNGAGQQRHTASLCGGDNPVLSVGPGWATEEDGAPPPEPAAPVTVTNNSPHRAMELYVFPDDGPKGDERLGTRVLDPGASVQISLEREGKCKFTVRSVFEGNVPDEVDRGIDFCPRSTVAVGAPRPAATP